MLIFYNVRLCNVNFDKYDTWTEEHLSGKFEIPTSFKMADKDQSTVRIVIKMVNNPLISLINTKH